MRIQLRFDTTSHEDLNVAPFATRQFRLLDTPLLSSEAVNAGDVIEAELLPDGTYRFLRIVERAPMRHYSWVVPQGWSESPGREAFMAKVEGAGGRWEHLLGGLLYVHIPVDSTFDPEAELDRYLSSDWPEA